MISRDSIIGGEGRQCTMDKPYVDATREEPEPMAGMAQPAHTDRTQTAPMQQPGNGRVKLRLAGAQALKGG